jgi:hypothetical protein
MPPVLYITDEIPERDSEEYCTIDALSKNYEVIVVARHGDKKTMNPIASRTEVCNNSLFLLHMILNEEQPSMVFIGKTTIADMLCRFLRKHRPIKICEHSGISDLLTSL